MSTLLEKCDVSYTIFERAAGVKPLGSAINIAATVLPLFKQIGIFDEFLYDLILNKVPRNKILFNKRVQGISESNNKVTIKTTDNCTYEGDIVVGADGAYRTVRRSLYETLKSKGVLPSSDQEDLFFSCTWLVGQIPELDSKDFPSVDLPFCDFKSFINKDKSYGITKFTTAQRGISWAVVHQLDAKSSKAAEAQQSQAGENSEWSPGAAQAMCDETRRLPLPIEGGQWTLGDLIDRTPKDLISKVTLEEKVFETWHHGCTVLLGDACHKSHPSGGHGAVTAMHDAVALADLIYVLLNSSSEMITKAFTEYHSERIPS
ncbi:hypothetical protein BGZ47_007324 [Haplosporangium gracile]|nr:hypothetical protein BGZ47_007324 [Haplosporangium gracile]